MANPSFDELRQRLREQFPALASRYRLNSLSMFGSRLHGTNRPDSDLDLLGRFDAVPSLLQLIEIENRLSDELGVKVDFVLQDSLRPSLRKSILEQAIPI